MSDVDLPDSVCRHYSLQHTSWSDETNLRSDTRGARRSLPRCQYSGLHHIPAQVGDSHHLFLPLVKHCCSGFETNVGGKGSQLSGGQKRMFGHPVDVPRLTKNQSVLRSLGHSFGIPRSFCSTRSVLDTRICFHFHVTHCTIILRRPRLSTRIQRRLYKKPWTKQLQAGPRLQLHTDCRQFRMRIGCGSCVCFERRSSCTHHFCSYFIKEGAVSESGTHDELVVKRGDYYEYAQLQALGRM